MATGDLHRMLHERVVFRAALARIMLGLYGMTVLPAMHPGTASLRPLFVGYLAWVAVVQVLIRRNMGGWIRAVAGGLVDLALLTLLVHRVGSAGTVLLSIYLFAGMTNALVTPPRVAMGLALTGALFYAALVVSESMGWIAYGPDAAAWGGHVAPSMREALLQAGVLAMLSLFATSMVVHLVKAVRQREVDLLEVNGQLEETSRRDPLTQLFNRRHLFARLQREIARIAEGTPLSVLMLDLDGFKRVNDEAGHMRGDALLKEIATALQKQCRETDLPARYGGDEFVVLLPNTDVTRAGAVAERVANAVRETGLRFDAKRPVTASVGLVQAEEGEEVASVLRRADQNAYRAKQSGGNRVAA